MNLMDRVEDARSRAHFFAQKRRKDAALYHLLGEVAVICEDAKGTKKEAELREAVITETMRLMQVNRSHFESDADIYRVVGRYVFGPVEASGNGWRYSTALREANKRGIAGVDLADWLAKNGGVNALFKLRPAVAKVRRTKTLYLTTQVEIPADGRLMLLLQRNELGWFDVVLQPPLVGTNWVRE